MSSLAPTFEGIESFSNGDTYALLPFRFIDLDQRRHVLTNAAGEHLVVTKDVVPALVRRNIQPDDALLLDLEARHFLTRSDRDVHLELLAAQIRTRQSRLPDIAALHIFVVTLRCDQSCGYCQVSRVSEDRQSFDMRKETADRAIEIMLSSPSKHLKVEFQGGESLLNFPLICHIVLQVNARARNRDISFVVATNLSVLTDEMLEFFAEHQVFISTSLDGPKALHNQNRPRPNHDAYERTVEGIKRCRNQLGEDSVSALMTCTASSLEQPEAIIDEYVQLGFNEIFLRSISPYGFAVKSATRLGYETERFLDFYRRGLAHILEINRGGVPFREVYSTIVLRRMLTSYATGYVDLQSPAGAGFGALVYNYDGDVYASDEGRMLAEMGDTTFRLGNVRQDSWENIYLNSPILNIAHETMNEGLPGCSECAFQLWCGSDPVRHHATQRDMIGHRPTSDFCRRNMEIMRHLVGLLEDDPEAARILRRWVQ